MAEELRVPASQGGLVRYFEEYKSRIQLKPEVVILLIIATIAAVIALRFIFPIK